MRDVGFPGFPKIFQVNMFSGKNQMNLLGCPLHTKPNIERTRTISGRFPFKQNTRLKRKKHSHLLTVGLVWFSGLLDLYATEPSLSATNKNDVVYLRIFVNHRCFWGETWWTFQQQHYVLHNGLWLVYRMLVE